jgi:hypothetical protein
VIGLFESIRVRIQAVYTKVIIKGDLKNLINQMKERKEQCLLGIEGPNQLGKGLHRSFREIKFEHVRRVANQVANFLANLATRDKKYRRE